MDNLKIVEVFDGRLPEYHLIKPGLVPEQDILIKIFDSHEEALQWCRHKGETPCGEEDPT